MIAQLFGMLRFFGKVLLIALGVSVVIGLSFLFTGRFSFQSYSDRLLWAGMITIFIGGLGGILGGLGSVARRDPLSESGARRDPLPERALPADSADARREARVRSVEGKHYYFAFQFWTLGLMCIAASALMGMFLGGEDATGQEALQDGRQAEPRATITEPVKVEVMPTPTVDVEAAFAMNRRLGRGVNLGNALEAPSEGEWGVYLTETHLDLIPEAGFDSVRIPIRWSARAAAEPPYTIKPEFFERIDWAIDQALSRGLVVVINTHHYEELYADPQGHRDRFLALWAQISERYQDYPDELLFEPLNEPHGNMTAPIWNSLLQEVISTIRKTNPYRILVVGPANWNNIDALDALQLPADDRRLIVTFHYYNPFHFTHQGAEWVQGSDAWLGTRWRGNTGEKRAVDRDLDRAAAWGEAHGRPLYMGEFGAYSKADMESRIRWTAYVARQAEAREITWAYWELCAGFGVYDQAREEWNRPLLEALLPRP